MMNRGSGGIQFRRGDVNGATLDPIPSGQGSGTLTLNDTTHEFSGNIWFDRQWFFTCDLFGKSSDGSTGQGPGLSWSWMDINLDNDDMLDI
jgi:hypothetical protein